jgi:hypothetical protein
MNKLFLLLFVPSIVCAMDDAAPAVVRMNDEDASYFSKEDHKKYCGFCCGAVCIIPAACCTYHWRAAMSEAFHQQCGNPLGYDSRREQFEREDKSLAVLLAGNMLPLTGFVLGYELGQVTYKLDRRLNALCDHQKEKSE